MFKLLLTITLMLNSCGQDDSAKSLLPSATPTPSATESNDPEAKKDGSKPDALASQSPSPLISASPAPSSSAAPVSEFQSLALIVQHPFETNKWKFDFSQDYNTYDNGKKFTTPRVWVSRKIAHGIFDCPMHTTILIGDSVGTIKFTVDFSKNGCGTTDTQYVFNFKISNKCQGYNQDTYKCGQNINYDLIEQ